MRIKWRSKIRPARYLVALALAAALVPLTMGAALRAFDRYEARGRASRIVQEADWLLDSGFYRDAIATLNQALALDPGSVYILKRRAFAHSRLGENPRVIADTTEVLRRAADESQAYELRAVAWMNLGQRGSAIDDLNRALELAPTWAEGFALRGQVLRDELLLKESLVDLDRAVALRGNAEHYYQRALTLIQLHDFRQAQLDLTKAIGLEPTRADLFERRAKVRAAQGDEAGAAADRLNAARWERVADFRETAVGAP